MQRQVDLLILDGVVVTMDDEDRILDDGGLAIQDDRIVAVGTSGQMRERYVASRTINAGRKIVVPGLVDTYGHAGHGMIRALYHPTHGWPMMDLYWHHTTEHWWYAEALLAATERLRFGVTTGASIIGAATRADSPVFGIRNAEAYAKVGIRAVLGVGPPDPIVSSLPKPWSGSHYEDGKWVRREFTYQEALSNSLQVIESWHGGADGRIRVALAASALFGRRVFHGRPKYDYQPSDVPIMIDKAEELRDLADRYRVQIHTHMFEGSVDFALQHFGLGRVQRLLGPDVVIAHGNGLRPSEVAVLGETHSNVATAPSTEENVWFGYPPIVELLEAGANVTIATDGSAPRFSFDLWKDISRAMWHQWVSHGSQHVLPPGKALRMVTIDAAHALGIGDQVGSLEPGKQADVVLIDCNRPHLTPLTFVPQILTYYVSGNDVDTVLVDGNILMEGGHILSVDVQEVLDNAHEASAQAFEGIDLDPYRQTGPAFWRGARY